MRLQASRVPNQRYWSASNELHSWLSHVSECSCRIWHIVKKLRWFVHCSVSSCLKVPPGQMGEELSHSVNVARLQQNLHAKVLLVPPHTEWRGRTWLKWTIAKKQNKTKQLLTLCRTSSGWALYIYRRVKVRTAAKDSSNLKFDENTLGSSGNNFFFFKCKPSSDFLVWSFSGWQRQMRWLADGHSSLTQH